MRHNLIRAIAVVVLSAAMSLGAYSLTRPRQAQAQSGQGVALLNCFDWNVNSSMPALVNGTLHNFDALVQIFRQGSGTPTSYWVGGAPACIDTGGNLWVFSKQSDGPNIGWVRYGYTMFHN